MDADSARAQVFGDTLSCEELRPAAFLTEALSAQAARQAGLRAESLLRALAVVEDSRNEDTDEYGGVSDIALTRIEAKLDLLTALVASKIGTRDDPMRTLRWSALGACLKVDDAVALGTVGALRVQPSDWLPESLVLPASVLASDVDGEGEGENHRLWLRFGALSPALGSAVERHLFRVHRRAIAEQRRPR